MKLLEICYNFLTVLIWNHSDNKNDLMPSAKLLSNHIKFNIGCIDFIRELFTNNKPLLYSESDITNILNDVVTICTRIWYNLGKHEPLSSYYKSKLLDFLRVLMVFNNKAIKSNQILVMAQLQSKKNTNLMYILREEGNIRYHSAS